MFSACSLCSWQLLGQTKNTACKESSTSLNAEHRAKQAGTRRFVPGFVLPRFDPIAGKLVVWAMLWDRKAGLVSDTMIFYCGNGQEETRS